MWAGYYFTVISETYVVLFPLPAEPNQGRAHIPNRPPHSIQDLGLSCPRSNKKGGRPANSGPPAKKLIARRDRGKNLRACALHVL